MARTSNIPQTFATKTFEGGPTVAPLSIEQQLRRAVLTCMLWEKEFYRDGNATADRIKVLASSLPFEKVADLCVEARTKYKLRHVPLWLLCSVIESGHKGSDVGDLIANVIQRPDEMSELLSLYWKNGKRPLTKQLKVGLAKAFNKFNEYSLAKFDKPGNITLRDVMFLSHAKPTAERADLYKRVANKAMVTPDTWETQLSAGADKKATWIRLIGEQKLGAQALLMNLRNMQEAGVHADVIRTALKNANPERVLPFQFISAARYGKQFEPELEKLMFKCLEGGAKLQGQTTLLLDHSGSMNEKLSEKSDLTRFDAASGLAMLLREVCQNVRVFTFTNSTPVEVPNRRGFALRDACASNEPWGGTSIGLAVDYVNKSVPADRLIVLTDEQSSDKVGGPKGKGYMINVATYEMTVGIGPWTRVAGWSEAVVDFIRVMEAQ